MTNGLTSQALFYPNRRIYEPKEKASISRGFEWRCFWSRSPFSSPESCLAFWISILTHSISTMFFFFFSKAILSSLPNPYLSMNSKNLGAKQISTKWVSYIQTCIHPTYGGRWKDEAKIQGRTCCLCYSRCLHGFCNRCISLCIPIYHGNGSRQKVRGSLKSHYWEK